MRRLCRLFNYVLIVILGLMLASCGDDIDDIFDHSNYHAAKKVSLDYIQAVANYNLGSAADFVYTSADQSDSVREKVKDLADKIKQKAAENEGIKEISSKQIKLFTDQSQHKRARANIEISFNKDGSNPNTETVELIKYSDQWQVKLFAD